MTAVLENVNKFSYLGVRRRPTYNEIIGLTKDNETLTGTLPDRTAAFFKASPEGSFFDGLDHLEILKKQQRILQRQVQDLLVKQNVRANGGTYHLERHRQQQSSSSSDTTSSSSTTPVSLGKDRGRLSAGIQADLQRRQQLLRDRQQQTGEAHAQELSGQSRLPTLDSFLSGMTSPLQRMIRPLPIPRRQPETVDLTRGEDIEAEEEFFPDEMTTAREEERPKSKLLQKKTLSNKYFKVE